VQKKSRNYLIGSAIFTFLLFVAILFARPIYKKLVNEINDKTQTLSNLLIENTGLKIKYKALSPSILTSFSISDIRVYDQRDELLMQINRTKVMYNLRQIFSKDVQKIVKSVVLDGVNLNATELSNYINNTYPEEVRKKNYDIQEILTQVETYLPTSFSLKNFHVDYEDSDVKLAGDLKKAALSYSDKKEIFNCLADASLSVLIKKYNHQLSGNLSVDAGLFPKNQTDNSTVEVKISQITEGNLNFNKINLLFVYADNKVTAKTTENAFPLDLNVVLDVDSKNLNVELTSKNFKPSQIVSVNDESTDENIRTVFESVKNIALNISAKADYNIDTERFAYNSSGDLIIPDSLIPGGLNAQYSIFGNDKKINIPALNINGPSYAVNADLAFVFKKFQLSGVAEIPYFKLPNGNEFSTEIYFDPKDKGFMAFSPQIFIGDNALTALQMDVNPLDDSVDFKLEVNDYSHIEESEPGILTIDGSYLFDSKYLQTSLSLNSVYLDSAANIASSVLEEKVSQQIKKISPKLSTYMLSTDAYCSTNFHSLSFNVPYILLADTKKDNFAVMLSANGNEQSIQLNQLNFAFGKQLLTASASLDRMIDSTDMFIMLDFAYNSVPYHLSGTIMPEVINFSGSYGADIQISFNKQNLAGHALFDNLPVKIDNATLALSLNADFNYTQENGPYVQISRFVMEETGTLFSANPKLSVVGNITKYGAQFNSITFSDNFSTLEGSSDINFNMYESKFDSAGMRFDLKNPMSAENISADISISTPNGNDFSKETLSILESLYIDSQLQFNNFSLNRFMTTKNDNNELTMSLFMTGPISHPYVSLNVGKLSLFIGGQMAYANGLVYVEDRDITVNDFNFKYAAMNLEDMAAQISLESMTGKVDAAIRAGIPGKTAKIPFHFEVKDSVIPKGKVYPDEFNAVLSVSNMSGELIKKSFDFDVNLMYLNKNLSFFSSENLGLFGSFGSSGDIYAKVLSENLMQAELTGSILKNDINLKLSGIEINVKELFNYLALDDVITVKTGTLQGTVGLKQTGINPELKGTVILSNPSFNLPSVIPNEITAEKFRILMDGNAISIPDSTFYVKNKHRFSVGGRILLNNWLLDSIEANVTTVDKDLVPFNFSNPLVSVDGELRCNVKAAIEDNNVNLSGYVFVENALVKSSIYEVTKKVDKPDFIISNKDKMNVHADLILQLGTHAMVNFDPLLRCIFVPNTTIGFVADVEDEYYEVNGNMKIKSGDISYLNRNFYIKEGSVKFNSDNLANPIVTIRAETREKDDRGENVRIILSAENQLLLDFEPKFSSIPSKSEAEIQSMLGQIVIGDSQKGSEVAMMAGDYALQSILFRNVENKLRNVMNIDIFSVRTNIIQNATASAKSKSVGNIFDNSSIYVGRYFGDMFYFDAMLNYSYNENYKDSKDILKGILPEIGVELELPFLSFLDSSSFNATSTLRWSMVPDIEKMWNEKQYIPASSVTLSWKFSF